MLYRLLAKCFLVLTLCVAGPAHAQRLEPIVNFENMPVKTKTGEPASPQEVREAIVAAGSRLNWDFADAEPGEPGRLRGTLIVRGTHVVEVDVPYSADHFSVLYLNSSQMSYRESEGVREIHRNYNVWVRELVHRISIQLAALVHKPASGVDSLAEVSFWESVRASTNPAELQAYLDQYPNGRFAVLARGRLAALGVTPKPVPPAPVAAAPAAAPKAAAPSGDDRVPRLGDSWTYRFLPKGRTGGGIKKYTVVVTEASRSGIRDRSTMEGAEAVEWEHSARQYIAPLGLSLFSPYLVAFDAMTPPSRLSDIENLDPRTCAPGWACSLKGRVVGPENITVAAGTFRTIKVLIEQSWTGGFQAGREVGGRVLTVWYAPEIKRAVKYESRGLPSSVIDTQFELELVSYKLN